MKVTSNKSKCVNSIGLIFIFYTSNDILKYVLVIYMI